MLNGCEPVCYKSVYSDGVIWVPEEKLMAVGKRNNSIVGIFLAEETENEVLMEGGRCKVFLRVILSNSLKM